MFNKLKENIANMSDPNKALEGMNTIHRDKAEQLLINGEEIIQCYGLLLDYVCITNKRLFFVDASLNGKKKVVSIPYHHIEEVNGDYGYIKGEVEIVTKHHTYELKIGKILADQFVKDVLTQVLH